MGPKAFWVPVMSLLLGISSCKSEECAPEGSLRCPPCTVCEGVAADDLDEAERSRYAMEWVAPPEWLLGKWSGTFPGDEALPAMEITAVVSDSSGQTHTDARFLVVRSTTTGEDDDLCAGEAVEPCEGIELPVLVSWQIRIDGEDFERAGRLVLEGSGKDLEPPARIPSGSVSIFESGKEHRFVVGFAPDGTLWLTPERDGAVPITIGAKEPVLE